MKGDVEAIRLALRGAKKIAGILYRGGLGEFYGDVKKAEEALVRIEERLEAEQLELWTKGEREMEIELQPCGHPTACIVAASDICVDDVDISSERVHEMPVSSTHDVTGYCSWCASLDAARAEEQERCAQVVEEWAGDPSIAKAIRELGDKEEPKCG